MNLSKILLYVIYLAVINDTNCQIISLLENITVTATTIEKTVEKIEINLSEMITKMVDTQAGMANSLDQIVRLLQMQNLKSENMASKLGNAADCHNQPQENTSSDMPTTISSLSEPLNQTLKFPVDCSSISAADNEDSGIYLIDPADNLGSLSVYCNMDTDGGGWTVFQRRFDGLVDFFLDWDQYEHGFGHVSGEHWLGLRKVHRLTSTGQWTLRIDLEDFDGNTGYAQYEDFQIGDADSFYRLSIGAYSGTAGYDALAYHNGRPFTTKDMDHDVCTLCQSNDGSCALRYQGSWWYGSCHDANLNGLYQGSTSPEPNHPSYSLMCWEKFSGSGYTPLKKSEMKIRRVH